MTRTEKIESLVNAISFLNDYSKPEADSYKLRNPLLLKSFSRPGKHEVDEHGRRRFESFQGGYRSAVWDVDLKISGKSNSGISPTDTLKNLLKVYGISHDEDQLVVVFFLRKALEDKTIDLLTPLQYFNEEA